MHTLEYYEAIKRKELLIDGASLVAQMVKNHIDHTDPYR